ncbi:MAG: NAD(P)-dependent oxidoreductase [Nitrospiraceae bacterium]|nr:MAG: NAD(P)-dependent oxidoreductase [Nitrospiraceae bacterium]
MKKLLVTGASGFLGWNICNLSKNEWDIYGTVFSHTAEIDGVNIIRIDLTDFGDLGKLFRELRPDAVIHTAAISDPNYCQKHKEESHKINVDASLRISGLCADFMIPCVFTSTDLVFNGLKAPYHEEDPVSPINIYGEQKVLAEEGILKEYPDAAVCRMPLMFGMQSPSASSFIQPMIKAMREGRELRLFTDEFRNPVSAQTAGKGLFVALQRVKGIIHLGGIERISRYDFGRLLAEITGHRDAGLIPCLQNDMRMAAPRAPDVTLESSKAYALGYSPLPLREELQHFRQSR